MDYMDSGHRPTQKKSIVVVVSLLIALIRDQVTKLKQSGLKACILKGDRVEGDEEERKEEQEGLAFSAMENLREFQLQIYWNKRKCLHKETVELPQDWFGTTTWQKKVFT